MLRIKDADNFRRTAAGLCLIGGPLLVLIGGLVTPWEEKDTLPSYLSALRRILPGPRPARSFSTWAFCSSCPASSG